MALLSVIRRWHFREGMPIREIERRTGLSRNTIRKYLRAGAVEPKFKVPDRPSNLDPFAEKLAAWLRVEAGKSRKQRRTAMQIYTDLVSLGYVGSYGRVAAFVRAWKAERQRDAQTSGRGTFVPLAFAPGEAFQFDWSEDWAVLGSERVKLQVAHTKLSHSKAFIVRAYLLQTHEMLFDALTQAFRVLGGVPRRGIFDNMKTAVDRIGSGKARQVNARFSAMASHYLFEPEFCNPASGWEKGQIEKNVQDARRRLWQPLPRFPGLAALNAWLEERCIAQWRDIQHGVLPGTVADAHADEALSLMPLGRPFDGFVEHSKRVSPTCLVHFERNRYSVPCEWVNAMVSVRVYHDHLMVVSPDGEFIRLKRCFDRDQTIYDWTHYISLVERKPGALRNGAPFKTMPEPLLDLQRQLLKHPGGDRVMAKVLSAVTLHGIEPVLVAVELALQVGRVSAEHILNILSRLQEPSKQIQELAVDIELLDPSQANVHRYDALRPNKGGDHVE